MLHFKDELGRRLLPAVELLAPAAGEAVADSDPHPYPAAESIITAPEIIVVGPETTR
jgi:hypothetical protein